MSATLEAKPAAPEAQEAAITHAEFMQHMTAMKSHYKSSNSNNGTGPTHAYALPVHLVVPTRAAPTPSATDGTAEVNAAVQTSKANATTFAQNQKNAVTAATNKLQSTHDTSSFAAQMNAQRAQAKAESDQHIDQEFDNLIAVGTKYPSQQKRILSLTQQIGAFFTNLLGSVANFFTDIYNKIVGWISSAVNWVEGAAAAVGNWISGAVSSISSFFSGL
jgi:hypothetical protein